jgi:autotransporter-associated beta strand protein
LTKNGAGTLRLTGTNTAGGALTIDAGVLAITGGNAIGDSSAVSLGGSSAALSVESGVETIGSLAGGFAPGAVVVLAAGSTLALGNDNSSTAFGWRTVRNRRRLGPAHFDGRRKQPHGHDSDQPGNPSTLEEQLTTSRPLSQCRWRFARVGAMRRLAPRRRR